MPYILALDQGTTSSRAIVFDHDGSIKAISQKEFTQIFPKPGWVEHNPDDIWSSQMSVALEAMNRANLRPRDITAIGITNQRETTIIWDRETGEPVANAIVWQDRRTAPFCDALRRDGCEQMIRDRTGLVIDAYFSGSKLSWILNNVPGVRRRAEAGHLAFGTVDTWLVWKMTNGRCHITDASNASRTMLYNIHTGTWDDDLLRLFEISVSMLPEVRASSEVYGKVATPSGLDGIPVAGIAGDQQAALFGQACFTPGLGKNTYGTGCFLLQNTGSRPVKSRHGLVTTIGWKADGAIQYALEGSVFIAGAVVQWLRDGLGLIRTADEMEPLAASVKDNGGLYFVPAFAGLGAPYWDQYARGAIIGLTRGTTAGHFARAALESIAYQVSDVLDAMQADSGISLEQLRVDGGAAKNNLLLQFQADLLGVPVVRPAVTETTALGAAYLAGLATSFWNSRAELESQWRTERRFEPQMAPERAAALRERWKDAVERSRAWEKP